MGSCLRSVMIYYGVDLCIGVVMSENHGARGKLTFLFH